MFGLKALQAEIDVIKKDFARMDSLLEDIISFNDKLIHKLEERDREIEKLRNDLEDYKWEHPADPDEDKKQKKLINDMRELLNYSGRARSEEDE